MWYPQQIVHRAYPTSQLSKNMQRWTSLLFFNILRQRQYCTDDIFKCIFLNENAWISLKISLKCASKVRINNIPALVQIMAWRQPGDKPLSEPTIIYWGIYTLQRKCHLDKICQKWQLPRLPMINFIYMTIFPSIFPSSNTGDRQSRRLFHSVEFIRHTWW